MENYEQGMSLCYDCVTKAVVISFRGEVHYIVGPFLNRTNAIKAAEEKCRLLGWQPSERRVA
jgi:hypothetical protein